MGRVVAIDGVWQVVKGSRFLRGAQEHVDGLAGYVRDFLAEHEGAVNEAGRPWTVELCADLLKMPPRTLRRWVGPDQGKPAAVITPATRKVQKSQAKSALSDPDQRRAVIAALPTDVRDDLRADLIELDAPQGRKCRHCPTHCPGGGR